MMALNDGTSEARVEAANAVRRLSHAMIGYHGADADLALIASMANDFAGRLEAGPSRVRPNDQMMRYPEPVADGGELTCWPECMVAGVAHPHGTGLRARRAGDEVTATVVLGPAHEGPPGRAHGGMMASLFDEVFGFVLWMETIPAYTAWLKVDYRKPIPLGENIELRGSVTERDGRKMSVAGTANLGRETVAEAEGLFIVPREFVSLLGDEAARD
jgi:acyl-coenzyme A thioesterase PaaI-like protein